MKRFREMILIGVALGLLFSCEGGSRKVNSCTSCLQHTSSGDSEYCVLGEPSQLYCATPCLTHADCLLDHWCVPVADQGTPWDDRAGWIRWVCMPDRFYSDKKRAVAVESCTTCTQFYAGTKCLEDTGASGQKFCSDPCTASSQCLTSCCADAVDGTYCAPPDYCTLSVITGCDLCTKANAGDKTACIKNPEDLGEKLCAAPCQTSNNCPFGQSCLPFIDARVSTLQYTLACMPSTGKKNVIRWPTNCLGICPTDTECIQVDNDYYCAEACTADSQCVTGCCEPEGYKGLRYCAPYSLCATYK